MSQTWLSPHPTLVTSSVLSWASVFTAIKISMVVKNKCICKEFHMDFQVNKMLLEGLDFVFLIETLNQRAQRIPAAKNARKVIHRLSSRVQLFSGVDKQNRRHSREQMQVGWLRGLESF